MAPPTWVVGQVLAAADVNSWFVPLAAYKTSTQSVTNSTVLVNDTQLSVTVAANAVYHLTLGLIYDGAVSTGSAAGIKVTYTVPSGTTLAYAAASVINSATTISDDVMPGSTAIGVQGGGTVGAGTAVAMIHSGILTTSASSGTVQLQWAQNVANATATRVFAGSHLILQRVG